MTRVNNYKSSKILFVDDEEKAQKYFRKACEADFEVMTASSVADAVAILDRQSDTIGLLVTDQRMPGQSGTDLLQHARARYPEIVRILTTAYSDLDSAIEAVNSGSIFQYVTKPWNLRELRGILLRAMDHYQIQRERDALLCEKLSVLQRMLMLDRARGLCVLGAALEGRVRFPLHAVRDYLLVLLELGHQTPSPAAAGWEDLWLSTVSESETAIEMTRKILQVAQPTEFADLKLTAITAKAEERQFEVVQRLNGDAAVVADSGMLQELADHLLRLSTVLWPEQPLRMTLDSQGHEDGIRFMIASTTGAKPSQEGLHKLLEVARHSRLVPSGPWLDLLAAHLLAAHHAGAVHLDLDSQPALILKLPLDARAASHPELPTDWLESLLVSTEA